MKLLFFPLLLFALIQSRFFKAYKNFWCVKALGSILGLVLIPVIFYTYNGAFGKSPDWLNISIFFVAAAIVCIFETRLLKKQKPNCKVKYLAIISLCAIAATFVIFTFYPPKLPLFKDPVTGGYGI